MGRGTEHAKWIRAKLSAERARRGWSLEQTARAIARETGGTLTKQSFAHWETFETQPKIDQLAAWARVLGMRLEVDLVWPDEEAVSVRLPIAVAPIARDLAALRPEDLRLVSDTIARLKPDNPE